MQDRELLQLAARAAGFGNGKFCWTESEYPKKSGCYGALWNYVGHMDTAELWNPLTDDGDAFRLAVSLGLTVVVETDMVFCRNQRSDKVFREQSKDRCASTRKAIVRAAAEIGKTMK